MVKERWKKYIKLKEEECEKEKGRADDIDIIDFVDGVWNCNVYFGEIINWSCCVILMCDLVLCEQVKTIRSFLLSS